MWTRCGRHLILNLNFEKTDVLQVIETDVNEMSNHEL